MYKKLVPGEWQTETNPFGGTRRFRMTGGIKEYEPTVTIDGIEVPQSELEDFNKRRAEEREQRLAASREKAQKEPEGTCPFKRGKNLLHVGCERNCAFFGGTACLLSVTVSQPAHDTQGMNCPIAGTCSTSCALYAGGCKFIELLKGV